MKLLQWREEGKRRGEAAGRWRGKGGMGAARNGRSGVREERWRKERRMKEEGKCRARKRRWLGGKKRGSQCKGGKEER